MKTTTSTGSTETVEASATARRVGGRFELVRELGRGASATTWLGREVSSGREVAVKVMRARCLEEWKHLDLFEREARVLGGLRHPAVPELLAFFEEPEAALGPELSIVMELVEGRSLAEHIARGPRLGQAELRSLALAILDTLEYLHGRSPPLYHRDIKPSNVMVRPDGSPVLIDFGGVCDGWRGPDDRGDTLVGTAGYMPPEQVLGQVGPWSDLYAQAWSTGLT